MFSVTGTQMAFKNLVGTGLYGGHQYNLLKPLLGIGLMYQSKVGEDKSPRLHTHAAVLRIKCR